MFNVKCPEEVLVIYICLTDVSAFVTVITLLVKDDCYNDDLKVPSIEDKAKNGHVLLYYYSTFC